MTGGVVRVISISTLRAFWMRPGRENAETPLKAWHAIVNNRDTDWHDLSDVKEAFPSASIVGDCVVFNIGGNKYRLVTRIRFARHVVYVLLVMTHQEYDRISWAEDCGCYAKPKRKDR
jgi:mRNA interferase HigB